MNHLITYDEAARFIKNPSLLAPCPNFTKIWALCKHITQALKLQKCPQSMLHRWTGLAMDPTMYMLLNPTPFFAPPVPGHVPVYLPLPPQRQSKMQKKPSCRTWIFCTHSSGCSSRTSTTASGFQWPNPHWMEPYDDYPAHSCTVGSILQQAKGQHCMEGWQIIQVIFPPTQCPQTALSLYWPILQNCAHHTESVHSRTADFKCHPSSPLIQYFPYEKEWRLGINYGQDMANTQDVHSWYIRTMPCCCPAQNTSGQQGYAPNHNMYNVSGNGKGNTDTNNNTTVTTITLTGVAATSGSMFENTYANTHVPWHSKVSTTINQLSTNLSALYQ